MAEVARSADEAPAKNAMLFWLGGRCYGVAADQVIRVAAGQPVRRLPLLPPAIRGVVAQAGKVVPVLDLRRLLDLPDSDDADGELLFVANGGETYAFGVDRVIQIGTYAALNETSHERPVHVDIDVLLAQALRESAAAPPVLTARSERPIATAMAAGVPAAPASQEPGAKKAMSLVVEANGSRHSLPLDCVVELCETLPIAAIPDPRPLFAGAAFFRDTLLPVISLDALLDRAAAENGAYKAFVIVDVDGRNAALAVDRIIGMSNEPAAGADPRGRLAKLLPEPAKAGGGASLRQVERADRKNETAYLLAELAGRICGFGLPSVMRIHSAGQVVPAPVGAGAMVTGVAAIGDRVVPVVDLAARLGLSPRRVGQHFIEFASPAAGTFAVMLDRILGITVIEREALIASPPGTPIGAVARSAQPGAELIWIVDAVAMAAEAGGQGNAGRSQ